MAQCQSHIFFPDDPMQSPQFSDCPRVAETRRRTFRMVLANGKPVVNLVVKKLCGTCAKEWDEQTTEGIERRVKLMGAA